MNENRPSSTHLSNWQPLARYETPCSGEDWDRLETWFLDALRPLSLPADFISKLAYSLRLSAACKRSETEQIHLVIYTARIDPAPDQTWGFFRMEREELPAGQVAIARQVNFYLYVEGRPDHL